MQRRKLLKRRSNENAHSPNYSGKSVLQSRLSAGIFRALSLARRFLYGFAAFLPVNLTFVSREFFLEKNRSKSMSDCSKCG
ncbi:hypothetical protein, partial [Faecalispora jeddahensis]|uniref:hypothetical protein n=1 Tax=Faecalispora jeddahensis TaxID=1414721 RepID=UPI0028AE732D